MTKPKTLREWMSDQQAPADIQEKMHELFLLSDQLLMDPTPYPTIAHVRLLLDSILDVIPEKNT
jgi:hypothetical protein